MITDPGRLPSGYGNPVGAAEVPAAEGVAEGEYGGGETLVGEV